MARTLVTAYTALPPEGARHCFGRPGAAADAQVLYPASAVAYTARPPTP